jgi:hypothetical protein
MKSMLNKLLRPIGYIGTLLAGAVGAYLMHDQIKTMVEKYITKK